MMIERLEEIRRKLGSRNADHINFLDAEWLIRELDNCRSLLGRALQSLQRHRDKGHNDTCSYALDESTKCDCGLAEARNIVRDILDDTVECYQETPPQEESVKK